MNRGVGMFRKFISITLLVSLIAVGGSGLLMIILGSLSFQLQMHPIHKIFGIVLCISGLFHIGFNFKPIKSYLKINKIAFSAAALCTLALLLLVAGLGKPLDREAVADIETRMQQLEQE